MSDALEEKQKMRNRTSFLRFYSGQASTTASNTTWERMKITMNNILATWQVASATKQEKD